MIQLTPLEKSVAVQQLIRLNVIKSKKEAKEEGIREGLEKGLEQGLEKGLEKGKKEGIKQGELIGEIRMLQKVLKHAASSKKELTGKTPEELRKLLKQLKAEL